MEIGKNYAGSFKGKCVKKELYKDGKIMAWIQDDEFDEMAIVVEDDVKYKEVLKNEL